MGLMSRLFGRADTEKRDLAFAALSPALDAAYMNGGSPVAESLAAVTGCVRVIASALSALPATLVDQDGDAAPATASAWALLRRPGRRHSWPALIAWVARELLLQGNAVVMLQMDGRGAITGLVPVPWRWIVPQIVAGALVYDVMNRSPEAVLLGLPARLLEGDVIHFRGQSDAGIIGQSVLSRARGPVAEGLEIEKLAAANWKNGMRPSGVLSLPTFLDDAKRKRFEEEFLPKFTGSLAAGRVPMLEGGWKFDAMALSSVDSEFLATRQLNTSQVAMLFGVPEILLHLGVRLPNDMAPFIVQFAQLALSPIVTAIEAEFDHVILPAGLHLNIDLDGLMRGSFSATVAALSALKQSGVVTANDVRRELQFSPIEGGDTLGTGPAPNWPADASGMPALHPSPGPTGAGLADPGNHANEGAAS